MDLTAMSAAAIDPAVIDLSDRDHADIERRALVERYFRGDLPPAEEVEFEAHFFACSRCQQDLELARELRQGLRGAAAGEAAGRATLTRFALVAWLARRRPAVRAVLLAAVLLLLALPAWWLAERGRGFERQAEQARQEAEAWQERFEGEQRRSTEAEERLAGRELGWEEERQRLEELAALPRPRAGDRAEDRAGDRASELARPLAGAPVLLLTTFRAGQQEEAPPTIEAQPSQGAFTLAVDAGADPRFASYRLTVTGAGGERLFRGEGLEPNALEVVMVTFPAGFFPPGDFRLTLEGILPEGAEEGEGGTEELGSYPFRIAAATP